MLSEMWRCSGFLGASPKFLVIISMIASDFLKLDFRNYVDDLIFKTRMKDFWRQFVYKQKCLALAQQCDQVILVPNRHTYDRKSPQNRHSKISQNRHIFGKNLHLCLFYCIFMQQFFLKNVKFRGIIF